MSTFLWFRGSDLRLVTPIHEADLREALNVCIRSLETLVELNVRLSDLLGLETPQDIAQLSLIIPLAERAAQAPDIKGINLKALRLHRSRNDVRELLACYERLKELHAEFDSELQPMAWRTEVAEIQSTLTSIRQTDWVRLLTLDYRTARKQLAELQRGRNPRDSESLDRLAELSASLSETLGLDVPDNVPDVKPIVCLAERAATAPDLRGISLQALEPPNVRLKVRESLRLLARLEQLHSEYDNVLRSDAWTAGLTETHRVLSTTGRSFWKRLISPAYRRAKEHVWTLCQSEPPTDVEEQIGLVKAILDEQQTRADIASLGATVEAVMGGHWRGDDSDRRAIETVAGWAIPLLEDIDSGEVDSRLAFSMTDEVDSERVRRLLPATQEALSSHKSNAEIEWSDSSVNHQLAVLQAIADEQNNRQKIDDLATTAEAVLGDLRNDSEAEEEHLIAVLQWIVALLADIDARKVRTGLALNMSDSLEARAIENTLREIKSLLASYRERIAELEDALKLDNKRQFGDTGGLASLSFSDQHNVMADWVAELSKVRQIASFNGAASNARDDGLAEVIGLVWEWQEASENLSNCFENSRFSSILSRAIMERDSLAKFNADIHGDRIGRFRSMDELSLLHNRARVSHAHWVQMPKFEGLGQLGILQREFAKRRRHLPIRQLMEQAGNAIQAIKPVFMMSPLSFCGNIPETWRARV